MARRRTFVLFASLLWLTARVYTDREARKVLIRDLAVTRIRWPNADTDFHQFPFLKVVNPLVG